MPYNRSESSPYWPCHKADLSVRLPSLPCRHPVVEKLMSGAIIDLLVASYRSRAQFTFFCGDEPDNLGGYDGQLEVVGRCLEWFVFDCEIPEFGETPARHWFSLHADELSCQDRAVAGDCLDFILSIFEIIEVTSGTGFTVHDLLRPGRCHHIREEVASEEIEPGQLLLSRIFPHRGDFALSGMAVLMNETATREIKQFICEGKLNPELILPDLDGVELENLFGRSLRNIVASDDLALLENKLRRYFNEIRPGHFTFEQLQTIVYDSGDSMDLIAYIDHEMDFFNRHEMDLIFTLILAVWEKSHSR